MKKIRFTAIVMLTLVLLLIETTFAAGTSLTVKVDGLTVNFPDAQPFIDNNNRTMIPMRMVCEALENTKVTWDGVKRLVIVEKDDDLPPKFDH